MSEVLRTDHLKLESPSILTKKFFFCLSVGGEGGWAPLVYASGRNLDFLLESTFATLAFRQ